MILTHADKMSPLWVKLLDYLHARLESNRVALEIASDEKTADKIRGKIAEDKLLLGLDQEIPETVPNVEV
jgi:hypothetical protein